MTDGVQLSAQATMDLTNSLAALRTLTAGMNTLKGATEQLNQAQAQYSQKSSKAFKELGDLISRIPGGGMLKEIFKESENGSALFARLGVGLSVITFAFAAYNAVIERNIARVQALVEVQQKFYDIAAKTRDLQDAQAKAGLGQNTTDYRRTIAAGGQPAIDDARGLEATGNFSHDLALQLTAALYSAFGPGKQTQAALGGLKMAGQIGLDPQALLQTLLQGGGSLDLPGVVKKMVADQLNESRRSYQGGTPLDQLDKELAATGADPFLQATGSAGAKAAGAAPAQRQAAIDLGARAIGKELADAIAPGNALLIDAFKQNAQEMKALREKADAQGAWSAFFANMGLAFGSQGSFENQIRLKNIANAEGAGLGPPQAPAAPQIKPYTGEGGFGPGGGF